MNKLLAVGVVSGVILLGGIAAQLSFTQGSATPETIVISPARKKEQMATLFVELAELIEEDKKTEARKTLAHFYRHDLTNVFTILREKWPIESMQLEYQVGQVLYGLGRREKKEVQLARLQLLREQLTTIVEKLPEPQPEVKDLAKHQPSGK